MSTTRTKPPAAPAAVKELPLSAKQVEYVRAKYAQVQSLLDEINAVSRFALFEHGTPAGNWSLSECRTKLVRAEGENNAG
jgi:hypothetical protein